MSLFNKIIKIISQHKFVTIGIVAVLAVAFVFTGDKSTDENISSNVFPVVTITSAAKLNSEQEISVVGTVRAFSEAAITAEASGRVTSVNASLGQTVPAGFVIATLENASERAAVLQAEGVYEAALSASEQSSVGLNEAQTNLIRSQNAAVSTYQNTYNTVNGVIRNNIDQFFANPDSKIPGLRISGNGQTSFLNSERVAFQTLLQDWQLDSTALNTKSDLNLALANARNHVDRTIVIVDTFIGLFNTDNSDDSYTDAELNSFSATFTNLRSTLQSAKISIDTDLAALDNAEDAVRRAEISAAGSHISASDAQVKQALGSLRSAQANLAKTILRTPISGTVNSVNTRVGEFVGNQEVVAQVANNNALEIITFIGDKEVDAFVVGSTVVIENKYEGTVTEVAPAVDPLTRKTEVRIAIETEEIQNGDTVTLTKTFTSDVLENQPVIVPLSAIKFEIEDGFIFKVKNGKLVSTPVELGVVRGGSVEIISGLSSTDEFVLDARGLQAGSEVEVRNK